MLYKYKNKRIHNLSFKEYCLLKWGKNRIEKDIQNQTNLPPSSTLIFLSFSSAEMTTKMEESETKMSHNPVIHLDQ